MSRTEENDGFTAEERQAMKDRAQEFRAKKKSAKLTPEQAVQDVLDKIAELPDEDRVLAERIHRLVTETAPHLTVRTYYGMPAYAKDGKVLCFFQPKSKFKVRYATFGFETIANLDDGTMWPTSFAVTELTDDHVAYLSDLVRRAAA